MNLILGNDAASELGAAVNADDISSDPARIVGRQEGNHRPDVLRLGHALECLHAEDDFAAGLDLGEIRHVGFHGTGRDGIDADTA
jgi:hypothetical protein